jgi:hypothetical protein
MAYFNMVFLPEKDEKAPGKTVPGKSCDNQDNGRRQAARVESAAGARRCRTNRTGRRTPLFIAAGAGRKRADAGFNHKPGGRAWRQPCLQKSSFRPSGREIFMVLMD